MRVELGDGTRGAGDVVTVDVTVGTAIEAYEEHRREKGNKEGALYCTTTRLRSFFTDPAAMLSDLTPAKCAALYQAVRTRPQTRLRDACVKAGTERQAPRWDTHPIGASGCQCRPYSADTHRNALMEARSLLKWCVSRRWLRANPLEGIEGKGKRRHGKPQLRIDEARRWMAKAVELAEAGEGGAVAAMMTLLLGMRASEVVGRVVRDLDDDGRLLWIPDSKTEAGRRKVEVPEVLRPHLQALAAGKVGNAPLFGEHWRDWPREWVQRICGEAGVPVVSAHSMRGLHATLAMSAGITAHVVAASVGHESERTTVESYAKPEAVAAAQQRRTLAILGGGKA